LSVAITDSYDVHPEYKLQPLDVGLYVIRYQAVSAGLHSVKVWTEGLDAVAELYEFWVRG
jgi:hypothetical protein